MATQNLSLITQQTEEEKKKKQLVDPTQASVAPKQLKSPTGLGVNPFAASTAVQQNKNNLAGVDTSIKKEALPIRTPATQASVTEQPNIRPPVNLGNIKTGAEVVQERAGQQQPSKQQSSKQEFLNEAFTPVDTSKDEALARDIANQAKQQSILDSRAKSGVAGFNLSGAQIGIEDTIGRKSARDLQDALLGIRRSARDEQRENIGLASQLESQAEQQQANKIGLALLAKELGLSPDVANRLLAGGDVTDITDLLSDEQVKNRDFFEQDNDPNTFFDSSRPLTDESGNEYLGSRRSGNGQIFDIYLTEDGRQVTKARTR